MLRAVIFIAAAAAASATTAAATTAAAAATTAAAGTSALSCRSAQITTTGSICSSVSGSFCSVSQDTANAQAVIVGALWSTYVSSTLTTQGNNICSIAFGGMGTSAWTDASKYCPTPACSSTVCGATPGTAGTAVVPTIPVYCCSSVKDYIGKWCSGINATIDTTGLAAAFIRYGLAAIANPLAAGASGFVIPPTCADTNCQAFNPGSASTVAYSVFAALVAALLALINF